MSIEQDDVTRLEGGLSAVLARLWGNWETRLERERAETAVAWQRVDAHRALLAKIEADARAIEAELAGLARAPEEHAELLAEKERQVLSSGDVHARELADLGVALDRVRADVREHAAAYQAGWDADKALAQVLRYLGSARTASTWDVFGGGLIADSIEHNRLGKAEEAARRAQRALDVYGRELADVGLNAPPQLPPMATRWILDTFFDNIITDVIQHQRIENTRAEVEETIRWVKEAGAFLRTRHTELTAERARLRVRREELLRD
ncbi:hypothetical protein [Nonomuraea angiospora]